MSYNILSNYTFQIAVINSKPARNPDVSNVITQTSPNQLLLLPQLQSTGTWRHVPILGKARNTCYHTVQDLLSSNSPFKNTKIKICSNIILPVVVYGCETRSLTLKEEQGSGIEE